MADVNARELVSRGDKHFSLKSMRDQLNQTLAETFYPERSDFTRTRIDGDEYADMMYESVPAQNRREFCDAMGAILRPRARKWFKAMVEEKRRTDRAMNKLDLITAELRAMLYNRRSNFQIEYQQGDNDFGAFGNAVHSLTESSNRDGVAVFDTHHLRDCAWAQDRHKNVNEMHRKFKLRLGNWEAMFPGVAMPEDYKSTCAKDPHHEVEVRHVVLPNSKYDAYAKKKLGKKPFVSIYVETAKQIVLKEGAYWEFPYLVRRWKRLDNSPYAYSPAASIGLIDARLLQAQARVILDAGERVVDPAMIATHEAVFGDVLTYAGAINWVDKDYDERLGGAIRPLETRGNIPIGLEMKADTRQLIAACWYLNKLTLPSDKDMTAYEVSERINEYIRSVGPVIEPFETDNAAMLDQLFAIGMRLGKFGPPESFPPELQGAEVEFEFDTPIQLAYERQKVSKAQETAQYVGGMMKIKPEVGDNVDWDRLTRDGARAIDGEAVWLLPSDQVVQTRQSRMQAMAQAQAEQKAQRMVADAHGIAEAVPKLADANDALPRLLGMDEEEQSGDSGLNQGMGPPVPALPPPTEQGLSDAAFAA